MKHLRGLPGVPSPSSLGSRPPAFFPTFRGVMKRRKLADRREVSLSSLPPVTQTVDEMNQLIDERFGLTHCPNCGEKVAVLVDGVCRDCGPGAA